MQTTQRGTLPTLLALLLGFGLMQIGNTLQGTLLSVRGGIWASLRLKLVRSEQASADETRGQILSVYAMKGLLAGIVGQLLLPATDPAGFRPFCIIAIIIAFALVPIALTRTVAPTPDQGGARQDCSARNAQRSFLS